MTQMDKTAVKIMQLNQQPNERSYWMTQPPQDRLSALEQIRKEYNQWHYHDQPGFQRVYSIIKQEKG